VFRLFWTIGNFPITLHFHHAISYRLEQRCGEFGSKYRACSIWTLKWFMLSYKSSATELSWFVYFEQLKTFQKTLMPWVGCYYWQLAKLKWTLAATVMGGLCFRKMMHSAMAICFIRFFYRFKPVTLHTVFENMLQHCEYVSERCG